ncbi:hypothetical protein [Acanthamoeba polyphaga mimivirus]|uniref:DUF4326 domain-containing protein n=6 Tax=Megamimivirinae TaxID=3044648 RepID=A0A2L2DIL9_MIMIV|nr:hypothetical protein MegaChil _gp0270 [Megavirus chiliensis]AFX92307.1 hypothetical protein CE11_00277 [Megavirus courdo11]AGD92177.1 hypothetical protein LBA_00257 [Megavirus lba]AVG46005.1 hypothetical protein [Acanthamoeba polyphaga mimivirus]AEQ32614.1 DUF4326 domain-containing protein [Megavirus chiliensis]AVG47106.1 hypothetical protein [Acanthamoeba polyphaga mimivirus]
MTNPKLVRIKRNKHGIIQDCDTYIGREICMGGWNLPQSKWHNPFTIKKYGSVKIVCDMYIKYIINSELFHDIPELEGKILGCWCEPNKKCINNEFFCHGSILIQLFHIIKQNNYNTKYVQKILKIIYNN